MSLNAAITLTNINKHRDAYQLGPIDLTFEEGMVYAIVGPNGAGKSTLFGLIMNALKPDKGEVEVFGEVYSQNPIKIKQRIGYASLNHFWEEFDMDLVNELVDFTSKWYASWDDRLFWTLAERLGLERSQKLRKLSTGMKQRLAICMALAIKPDLLLFDEATNGLDFQTSRLIHDELVRFMSQPGKTVVFATHILDEIKQLADYIVFIHEGRVLGTFEKDMLLGDWKGFWVDQIPDEVKDWPDITAIERQGHSLIRLVSSDARITECKLAQLGIKVSRIQAIDLQEVLIHLVETKY